MPLGERYGNKRHRDGNEERVGEIDQNVGARNGGKGGELQIRAKTGIHDVAFGFSEIIKVLVIEHKSVGILHFLELLLRHGVQIHAQNVVAQNDHSGNHFRIQHHSREQRVQCEIEGVLTVVGNHSVVPVFTVQRDGLTPAKGGGVCGVLTVADLTDRIELVWFEGQQNRVVFCNVRKRGKVPSVERCCPSTMLKE